MNQAVTDSHSQVSSALLEQLGLDHDPFVQAEDSDYFYDGGNRRQIVEQLIHLCRFSKQLVVLTGASGVGTSRLLDEVLLQLQEVMDCCDINAEVDNSPQAILCALAEQLQFDLPDPLTPDAFVEVLKSNAFMGDPQPILLAIDQAHFLSIEALQMLQLMRQLGGKMIKILLVGEYQVEQLVLLAGFTKTQLSVLTLEPLTRNEMSHYLKGLLATAGYRGELPFSADQLAVLHEQSEGNFADLLRLAPVLLANDNHFAAPGLRARLGIPLTHAATVVVIILALAATFFYRSGADTRAAARPIPLVLAPAADSDADSMGANSAEVSPPPEKQGAENLAATDKPAVEPIAASPQSGVIERVAVAESSVATVISDSRSEQLAPQSQTTQAAVSAAIAPGNEGINSGADTSDNADTLSVPPQPDTLSAAPVPARSAPVTAVAEPAPQADVAAAPTGSQRHYSTSRQQALSAREQRLLVLPATDYMLQLLGTYEEQRARELVEQYIGRLSITYFETRYQGKPWYVVLVGPYPDKAAARLAVGELPAALQQQQPWPRSLAGIQADLNKRSL